jgi:hypothetical protein
MRDNSHSERLATDQRCMRRDGIVYTYTALMDADDLRPTQRKPARNGHGLTGTGTRELDGENCCACRQHGVACCLGHTDTIDTKADHVWL